MAKPAEANLTYYQGDDETWPVRLTTQSDGLPIDITGATITCELRLGFADEAPVAQTATCTITDGADGRFEISLTSVQTKTMAGTTYKYDVEIELGGKTRTYLKGEISGAKEVTD